VRRTNSATTDTAIPQIARVPDKRGDGHLANTTRRKREKHAIPTQMIKRFARYAARNPRDPGAAGTRGGRNIIDEAKTKIASVKMLNPSIGCSNSRNVTNPPSNPSAPISLSVVCMAEKIRMPNV
jgi:hypothetical protein